MSPRSNGFTCLSGKSRLRETVGAELPTFQREAEVTGHPVRMDPSGSIRRLSAILMADVVGYSRLMGQDEEATVSTLSNYRGVFNSYIPKFRGRVVDTAGDGFLATFDGPARGGEASRPTLPSPPSSPLRPSDLEV